MSVKPLEGALEVQKTETVRLPARPSQKNGHHPRDSLISDFPTLRPQKPRIHKAEQDDRSRPSSTRDNLRALVIRFDPSVDPRGNNSATEFCQSHVPHPLPRPHSRPNDSRSAVPVCSGSAQGPRAWSPVNTRGRYIRSQLCRPRPESEQGGGWAAV